ncbi:MAG: hypothetical protein R2911_25435 [Caldilineaceae bacterium]
MSITPMADSHLLDCATLTVCWPWPNREPARRFRSPDGAALALRK